MNKNIKIAIMLIGLLFSVANAADAADITPPVVTAFMILSSSSSLTVPVTMFTATDNLGVTGYKLTETNLKPSASAAGWSGAAPPNYTFAAAGWKMIYAWAKDAAGNVSSSRSAYVYIRLPAADITPPAVTAFSIQSSSSSLTVPVTTFTATDNVKVTGYKLTETNLKPSASATGWASSAPLNYTFAAAGSKILYAWAKDAAGNVSNSRSASVNINLPAADTMPPAVTAFNIPSSSSSLTVPVTTLTATDNVGVTGYQLTESSVKPSSGSIGWSGAAPSSYTFPSDGAKTLYAWAKDAAGNVSNSRSSSVAITIPPPDPGKPHGSLTWNGTAICLQCHQQEATDMHGSVHYQWKGDAPYAISGPSVQGKLDMAINSYCINTLGNWNACGNCHAGLGLKPEPTASQAQLQNIDCLLCHQKDYKRKKVNGVFVPDTAGMAISMDQAVRTVHKPERVNCLQCHAKAGGGDAYKRGDIALAQVSTADRNFDVHMATSGANLVCQSCHIAQDHRIAGRGSDLRETDLDVKMNCTTSTCHQNKTTASGHATTDVNKHIARVACQTCHISLYGRNASDTAATEATETHRDWTQPYTTSSGAIHPTPALANNLKPEYKFWNGHSYNQNLGDIASIDPVTGKYPTSRPEGAINDSASKLYPFKYKTAYQPIATNRSKLIAVDTSVYFATGNLDSAVKAGLVNMGLSSSEPYSMITTDTYQLITHQVMTKDKALACNQCHGTTAQMDLKGRLGYSMKGTQSTTCRQCHGAKDTISFTSLHNKHVKDKKYDCAWCHTFSRPERGLQAAGN
jgi:hypothetical protein